MAAAPISSTDLSRRLAIALKWEDNGEAWHNAEGERMGDSRGHEPFDPANDRNHLALYVLSEVTARHLHHRMFDVLVRGWDTRPGPDRDADDLAMWAWENPTALAAAALKVLEENP